MGEAGANLAEDVLLRYANVGEGELGGVLRMHADLVEVPSALKAGHPSFEDEVIFQPTPTPGSGGGSPG
jgi:hypothetical protein